MSTFVQPLYAPPFPPGEGIDDTALVVFDQAVQAALRAAHDEKVLALLRTLKNRLGLTHSEYLTYISTVDASYNANLGARDQMLTVLERQYPNPTLGDSAQGRTWSAQVDMFVDAGGQGAHMQSVGSHLIDALKASGRFTEPDTPEPS